MSEMFKNYPQPDDYIPNNRRKCKCKCGLKIMTGESTSHSFEIPFNVSKDCLDYQIIYRYNLNHYLIITKDRIETIIDEDKNTSILTCSLSAEETMLFEHNLLDADVQIKFFMLDNSVTFTEVYKIKVTKSLDNDEIVPPTPIIIKGIGYTED